MSTPVNDRKSQPNHGLYPLFSGMSHQKNDFLKQADNKGAVTRSFLKYLYRKKDGRDEE